MIKVCVIGGFEQTDKLHNLNIITSKIKGFKFIFPDLDHIKDLNKYYDLIKDSINECNNIILLNNSKNTNKFSVIFGMAFQSNKDLKINSIENIIKYFEKIGEDIDATTSK